MMSQISPAKPDVTLAEPQCNEAAGVVKAVYSRDGRLRKHADYQRAYQASRKHFSPSMTWFLARRDGEHRATPARVGLTAGKVLGKAHERNRIKRRMRELVQKHFGELPAGIDVILHPRRQVMTMDFGKLESEILRIFRQAAAQSSAIPASAVRNAAQ
jgi:ribonuclease P protein component